MGENIIRVLFCILVNKIIQLQKASVFKIILYTVFQMIAHTNYINMHVNELNPIGHDCT